MTAPVGVLAKAAAVLRAFRPDDHGLRFAEIARRTGLAKATLHRLLGELVDLQLLEVEDGEYRLGIAVFELGMRASVERALVEAALPPMEDLHAAVGQVVHLGVRSGSEVVYLVKITADGAVGTPSRLGGRMPLHATAIGKVLLAHADPRHRAEILSGPLARLTPRTVVAPGLLVRQLERVTQTGVAFEQEESAPGITCVASGVLDAQGRTVAALSVTGPMTSFVPARHADAVRRTAARVSTRLRTLAVRPPA